MRQREKKVLVIDDEGIIRDCCMRALSDKGFSVDTAADGPEGLKMISSNKYDIIFLDLIMPRMDGQKVIQSIRDLPENTKLIIISGYSTDEARTKAREIGADLYLEKPFAPSDLIDAIHAVTE